jgi:hypothetical protein
MRIHSFVVGGVLLLAGFIAGQLVQPGDTVLAQDMREFYISQEWGQLRGSMSNRLLMFEDENGTIRIVDLAEFDPLTKMLKIERILTRK